MLMQSFIILESKVIRVLPFPHLSFIDLPPFFQTSLLWTRVPRNFRKQEITQPPDSPSTGTNHNISHPPSSLSSQPPTNQTFSHVPNHASPFRFPFNFHIFPSSLTYLRDPSRLTCIQKHDTYFRYLVFVVGLFQSFISWRKV